MSDKWYTGSTNDLRKRLKQHNDGESSYTKRHRPYEIIYYEACGNKEDAMLREKYLKTGMGKRYLKNRLRHFLSLTGLILLILVGLLGPVAQVNAQPAPSTMVPGVAETPQTQSTMVPGVAETPSTMSTMVPGVAETPSTFTMVPTTPLQNAETRLATDQARLRALTADPSATEVQITALTKQVEQDQTTVNALRSGSKPDPNDLGSQLKGGCSVWSAAGIGNCVLLIVYWTWFQIPSALLWLSAKFFNIMISVGLDSKLTSSANFIKNGWVIVRDLSNIFFILVLLYIAIKTILGLGHETKKMIAEVIIMALLINFSMFFTKIVIDSSNIVALIFYNKLDVDNNLNADGSKREYTPSSGEKDASGYFYRNFDATRIVDMKTLEKLQSEPIKGQPVPAEPLPFGLTLTLILIAGAIMYVAAYVFFVSGLMFLGRLVELWALIIFSPFAFMSRTLPELRSKVEYIGWDEWFKKLISTAFMAPIFMFFIFLISLLIGSGLVQNFPKGTGFFGTILGVLFPALVIFSLMFKAVKFAKKGGGQFGEIMLKGAKMAGGLAVTGLAAAATGGTALALRAGVGGLGGTALGKLAEKAEKSGSKFGRFTGEKLRDVKSFAQKSSFDVRNAPGVGSLAKAGGINLGTAQSGGWSEMKKQQVEKRQKRAEELEKRGTVKEKDAVADAEIKLKEATLPVKLKLEDADREIDKARKDLQDAAPSGKDAAAVVLKAAKDAKETIRNSANGGAGLKVLETAVHKAKQDLDEKSDEITTKYAKKISSDSSKTWNQILRFGQYSRAGADEAARKIRSGTKLDSGEKPH